MHIYSDTALIFLKKVRAFSFEILRSEMQLPFQKKRLLYNNRYYPLDFAVFEHEKILGEYDPNYFQIKINKRLIYQSNDYHLKNIIRHELAHYLTHLIFGLNIQPHGKEFLSVCKRFYFDREISSASIEIGHLTSDNTTIQENKIIQKVQKLLRLSESNNKHEAEMATLKANQLLKNHNLSLINSKQHDEDESETALSRVLEFKKVTGKVQAIYKILHHFYVVPVFSYGQKSTSLEIIGERNNVICAEYVAHFLDKILERLYSEEKAKNGFSGVRSKNSFMHGVAEGFVERFEKEINLKATTLLIHRQLEVHLNKVYPKMRGRVSQSKKIDKNAMAMGKKTGRKLSISKGLTQKTKQKLVSYLSEFNK
jgi:predicted SprT family Zn-dependent metalloprotease